MLDLSSSLKPQTVKVTCWSKTVPFPQKKLYLAVLVTIPSLSWIGRQMWKIWTGGSLVLSILIFVLSLSLSYGQGKRNNLISDVWKTPSSPRNHFPHRHSSRNLDLRSWTSQDCKTWAKLDQVLLTNFWLLLLKPNLFFWFHDCNQQEPCLSCWVFIF